MPGKIDASVLQRGWLHAHEEDTPGRAVFRPDTTPLPPARGRTGYVFEPGGKVIKRGPGPADRTAAKVGTWTLTPDGRVVLTFQSGEEEVLAVDSVEPDRLVIRKT